MTNFIKVFLIWLFGIQIIRGFEDVDKIVQEVEQLQSNFNEKDYKNINGYFGEQNEFGLREGVGIYRSPNGDYHFGQWKRNLRHGLGKSYVAATGDLYIGQFSFDSQHGKGRLTTIDGDKYEGDWIVGNQDGKGTYYWADGSKYSGEWIKGNPDGKGTWAFVSTHTEHHQQCLTSEEERAARALAREARVLVEPSATGKCSGTISRASPSLPSVGSLAVEVSSVSRA